MKNKCITIISLLFGTVVYGQQSVNCAGGDATGSGGSQSYSIGQVVYQTSSGGDNSVSEGVQQPFEILVTGLDLAPGVSLGWSSYPNPVSDVLILKAEAEQNLSGMSYNLYNSSGQLLNTAQIQEESTTISTRGIADGLYTLRLMKGGEALKSFTVIKR